MALELNKFENLGTLSKPEVDQNWTDIETFSDPSVADVLTLTSGKKAITPKSVGDALAWTPVPYAAQIVLDGGTFSQAEVTLTGNAELGQPVNFDRGTKYLMVKGDSATERQLTFDTNFFKGDLPVINNATLSRWFLLCIVAYSSDHYIVTSTRAL